MLMGSRVDGEGKEGEKARTIRCRVGTSLVTGEHVERCVAVNGYHDAQETAQRPKWKVEKREDETGAISPGQGKSNAPWALSADV